MTSTTVTLHDIILPDNLATQITEQWIDFDNRRAPWKTAKEEIRRYVYATSTRDTTNSSLPWKNSTTIPKLCQIRDNLLANYKAILVPNRKPFTWLANERDSASKDKRDAITNYMTWVTDQPSFRHEIDKILLDYVDFGNCFATIEWVDERQVHKDGSTKSGFVGPALRRISPLDITFNPTAENFQNTPKIIRSLISLGELKGYLEKLSVDDNYEDYEKLYKYLRDIRAQACQYNGDWEQRDRLYEMEGFSTFKEYLTSDTVEILTFYGDIYDINTDTFLKNHMITVVDRHKLIGKKPNPSYFGTPPIFHTSWRKRQDNLWGMGPLDNLIGLQYRIDHVENLKADVFDLTTYPVQLVTGFVEDFTWQPGEKIYASEEGNVQLVSPDVNALNANFEIQNIERLMEEMAGAPREAMGFRTPGEKTMYEVQSLENAAGRIFQHRITQFEEEFEERVYNAMLEMARRHMTGLNTIRVMDDEFKYASFQALTVEDITGIGRIKPVAARHFAEQARMIQNLTSLSQTQLWPYVQPHFSSVKLARVYEKAFDLEDLEIVTPYISLAEQAEAQKQAQAYQEMVMSATTTATGMGDDFDINPVPQVQIGETPEGEPVQ